MPRNFSLRNAALALLLVLAAAVTGGVLLVRKHAYSGPRTEPESWNAAVGRQRIVDEARKLSGILYDPLQGYFGDFGGKAGLIVCMDVPVIAYRNAGASLRRLLEADYRAHPEHFNPRDGKPGNPFFHRRARNLYNYCQATGRLKLDGRPLPADVVFFSHGPKGAITHIALISTVAADGRIDVVEASRDYWYLTRETSLKDVTRRGWVFRGFGDVLSPSRG
jgi:uncharacterized protein YijF (DUF1287 family)